MVYLADKEYRDLISTLLLPGLLIFQVGVNVQHVESVDFYGLFSNCYYYFSYLLSGAYCLFFSSHCSSMFLDCRAYYSRWVNGNIVSGGLGDLFLGVKFKCCILNFC